MCCIVGCIVGEGRLVMRMDRRVYRRMDGIVGMNCWLSSGMDCRLVGRMDSKQSDEW